MSEIINLKIGHVVSLPVGQGKGRIVHLKDKVADVLDMQGNIQNLYISALCHVKASKFVKERASKIATFHRIHKTIEKLFKNGTPPEFDGINLNTAIQLLIGGTYLMKLNQEAQEILENLLNSNSFQNLLRNEYSSEEVHKMMAYMKHLLKLTEENRKKGFQNLLTSLSADPVESPELIRNANMFKDPEKAMGIMRLNRAKISDIFLDCLREEHRV